MFRKISLSIENELVQLSPLAKRPKQLARQFRISRNDKNTLREGFAVRETAKTTCEEVSPFAK
jgi:hypothetical protein